MRGARLVAFCLTVAALVPIANAEADAVLFSLPEQPLPNALISFAVQARVSISVMRDDVTPDIKSAAVYGRMSSSAALESMLADTGFVAQEVNATAFRLVREAEVGLTVPGADIPHQILTVQPPPDPRYVDSSDRLAPVIVTSLRRHAALIDLPYSVSQVDNARIERTGARTADDIGFDTVGMLTTNVGPGRNKIILRGLSDGALTGQTKSNVGVYLDETRLTFSAPDPALELVDISAVEVLRGPQGTLFGAGSLGGIYRMVTNAPDLNQTAGSVLGGMSSVGGSSNPGSVFEGVFNTPLFPDRLGLRAVAYTSQSPGWLDNPTLGISNTNSTQKIGGRLAVEARLGDSWTVRASGVGQNIDTDDAQYVDAQFEETVRTAHVREPHDNRFLLSSLSARGATPYGQLEASFSALGHRIDDVVDATGVFEALGVSTSTVASDEVSNDIRILNQDVRLRGVSGLFPWSLGVFSSEVEKISESLVRTVPDGMEVYATRRREEIYEYAVFGDLTWPVTDWLDVSVGARAFLIDTSARIQRREPIAGIADEVTRGARDEGIAPRIEISATLRPEIMVFASASAGYRPGGLNATGRVFSQEHATYSADELWNYELGVKSSFANDRLRVRATTFVQTWENVQTDQLFDNGFLYTGNVGDARNLGFEVEAELLRVLNSDFALNFTTIDPEIVSPAIVLPSAPDALPGAPHMIAGASVSTDWGEILGVQLSSHLGGQFIGQANTSFVGSAATETDKYTVVNASIQMRRSDWSADLYADNVLDAEAATFAYANPINSGGTSNVTPLTPIEIGVRLKRSF